MNFKGRTKIYSDILIQEDTNFDINLIPEILKNAMKIHEKNVMEIEVLENQYYNITDILNKQNKQRSDINNKLAVPKQYEIVRKINSYIFGLPAELTARNSDKQMQVEKLSLYHNVINEHAENQNLTLNAAISGVSYMHISPENVEENNGVPFKIYTERFHPRNTFIVYANNIKAKSMLAVNFYTIMEKQVKNNITNEIKVTMFSVWTNKFFYIFKRYGNDVYENVMQNVPTLDNNNMYTKEVAYPLLYNKLPIVEFRYNQRGMGIFEIAIDLINALNIVLSGDIDQMQQAIDYILLLTNCKLSEEVNLNSRLLEIESLNAGNPATAEILKSNYSRNQTPAFVELLSVLIDKAVGMPTRKSQAVTGGGDTGLGAANSNGMRDLEDNANICESQMQLTKRNQIAVELAICNEQRDNNIIGLNLIDIDIQFPRNQLDNLIVSTQSFVSLISSGMAIEDALKICELTPDVISTSLRMSNNIDNNLKKQLLYEIELINAKTTNNVQNNNINQVADVTTPITEEI